MYAKGGLRFEWESKYIVLVHRERAISRSRRKNVLYVLL